MKPKAKALKKKLGFSMKAGQAYEKGVRSKKGQEKREHQRKVATAWVDEQ